MGSFHSTTLVPLDENVWFQCGTMTMGPYNKSYDLWLERTARSDEVNVVHASPSGYTCGTFQIKNDRIIRWNVGKRIEYLEKIAHESRPGLTVFASPVDGSRGYSAIRLSPAAKTTYKSSDTDESIRDLLKFLFGPLLDVE